jgi:hypothetical protein
MAGQPPNPATNLNIDLPPPSVSSQSSVAFTPRSSSVADDSDTEFDPTPLQSPRGGPEYDDLPPSYDEAQYQAVSDARNGVTPLDPNQIEAHRLTINEGPDEPEVWEYRIRGEELDTANEEAPEYSNITTDQGTTVPVQHVPSSADIPVGRTGFGDPVPSSSADLTAELTTRALNFTRHEPDADIQNAPRLARHVAIPQQGNPGVTFEPAQFLRAYAKALHAHSIRPAEFTEFLDGLNAVCLASNTTVADLLPRTSSENNTSSIVHDYIRGANEAFFAPRGLRVSLESLAALIERLSIPLERGQQAGVIASALDSTINAERRAQILHPWIEAIHTDVPAPSSHSLMLREMAERLRTRTGNESAIPANKGKSPSRQQESEDPPHSGLEDVRNQSHQATPESHSHHGRGRGGHRGGPSGIPGNGTFGGPAYGPFGAPPNGPFGAPGSGPFGPPGNGSFGPPGNVPLGHPGHGPSGGRGRGRRSGRNRGSHGRSDRAPDGLPGYCPSQPANEWSALGQNIGKWGEEFGKRMGDWGQQFGQQANNWGQDVGNRSSAWGQDVGRQASAFGQGVAASASVSISGQRPGPSSAQADNALPPSYEEGPGGQQTGVFRGDSKTSHDPPKYEDMAKKNKSVEHDEDDDDSSISSDSSDSNSDYETDSDDGQYADGAWDFEKRIQEINRQAEASAQKGEKTPEEIAEEREHAIRMANGAKIAADRKVADQGHRRELRSMLREYQRRSRDDKRQYRQRKRELKASLRSKGKGKGKAKKSSEWKEAKREYKEKRKYWKKAKLEARQRYREGKRERSRSWNGFPNEDVKQMAWVVIENLNTR